MSMPQDFHFSFDPSVFPTPPPLPSSADLFSPTETNDLLGFLDEFNNFNWETDNFYPTAGSVPDSVRHAPYSNPHIATVGTLNGRPRRAVRAVTTSRSARSPSQASTTSDSSSAPQKTAKPRPLLSTPQKRLNHIMSEQKRRNAIRDGYAQLIALLAPAGSAPGISMPTRGRPKGSGSRGKGQTKGKSGVLFRAVEYCKWLEEGRDALLMEVTRLENAAAMMENAALIHEIHA